MEANTYPAWKLKIQPGIIVQSAEGIHTIRARDSQQFAAQEHQKPRPVSNTFG